MLSDCNVDTFVATTDPVRAQKFYEEVLGLRLIEDNGFARIFATANATLRVTEVPEVVPAGYTVLGWVVDDIEEVVDGLVAREVTILEFPGMDQDSRQIWATPDGGRVAWFHDPDGNTLSISQPGT
jgi:catechol 2,3-dioxygenase-like lactoylglutathione lyase family enzyme